MTEQQLFVLNNLSEAVYISPTDLGIAYGRTCGKILGSSWACPKLKVLVELGYARRHNGQYRRTAKGTACCTRRP